MRGRRPSVVLGVGGGIAAYKVASLLRLLTEGGARVRVVPTDAALRFVGEATWAALSGEPVATGVWDDVHEVPHVALGRRADLVVVAPATADLLARAAHGLADDLLGAVLLTARCPVLMAPAMHTEMWEHPATVANVALLRERGVHVMDPGVGRLTGSDTGAGRLREPEEIHAEALTLLLGAAGTTGTARGTDDGVTTTGQPGDLVGRRVVVSAGGTREMLDPVRFLGNASSGRQGIALARAAAARGAEVVLVAAHVDVALPEAPGTEVVRVSSTAELDAAVRAAAPDADAVVMAAAVADFRPARLADAKIKKSAGSGAPALELEPTQDVLAGLVAARAAGDLPASTVLVGFAAETGDGTATVLEHGRAKLARKGADAIVVNEVGHGRGFGDVPTTATLIERAGDGALSEGTTVGPGPKSVVADAVWDLVVARWARDGS